MKLIVALGLFLTMFVLDSPGNQLPVWLQSILAWGTLVLLIEEFRGYLRKRPRA